MENKGGKGKNEKRKSRLKEKFLVNVLPQVKKLFRR